MCSGLRLLKIATSKTQPSTRPSTSAWLETSMATARTPRSRMTREQRLQVGRLGSGALGLDALVADAGLDGADQAGQPARRRLRGGGPQPALDEVGGGGLARGAGDADLEEILAGRSVDRDRQAAHPGARVVDDQDRQAGLGGAVRARGVGQDRGGAEVGGLGDEVGAVQPGARQRRVDVARADRPGVMGDAGDRYIACTAGRGRGAQLLGEVRQGGGADPLGAGRSRICAGPALLERAGLWGLISV